LQLSRYPIELEQEKEDFPFSSILAETGGTMGLFLGLSILQLLSFAGTTWLRLVRLTRNAYEKIKFAIWNRREKKTEYHTIT